MKNIVGLILAKSQSNRLPGKNTKDFGGRPMFLINVEKGLSVLDRLYVSSDDQKILDQAAAAGADTILRGQELCGDVPDIPVYQHAVKNILAGGNKIDGLVAIHANNPNISQDLIAKTQQFLEMGFDEVMTCYPLTKNSDYKKQHYPIYGSIRGISIKRLDNYADPYYPQAQALLVDDSIEIETQSDYEQALAQIIKK